MTRDDLGRAVALMMRSPIHRRWSLLDVEHAIVPPLALGQYAFWNEGRGGLATWGFLSAAARERLLARQHLHWSDWRSGTELWFVDFICPIGARRFFRWLKDEVHKDAPLAQWPRSFGTGKVQKIGFTERKRHVVEARVA